MDADLTPYVGIFFVGTVFIVVMVAFVAVFIVAVVWFLRSQRRRRNTWSAGTGYRGGSNDDGWSGNQIGGSSDYGSAGNAHQESSHGQQLWRRQQRLTLRTGRGARGML